MDPASLSPEMLTLVAERFKVLAEPVRLQILNALREGEKTVTTLIEETGLRQANLSKHLQLLYGMGFVDRRKLGLYVYYRLADDDIFQLCDLMCGRLIVQADQRQAMLRAG